DQTLHDLFISPKASDLHFNQIPSTSTIKGTGRRVPAAAFLFRLTGLPGRPLSTYVPSLSGLTCLLFFPFPVYLPRSVSKAFQTSENIINTSEKRLIEFKTSKAKL
ncbi:MAG: hypothetical protein IKK38_00425, partial [Spirochaetaceae bacterium]|nr:hypothetical protein [Spirochaetaceae bacterium]